MQIRLKNRSASLLKKSQWVVIGKIAHSRVFKAVAEAVQELALAAAKPLVKDAQGVALEHANHHVQDRAEEAAVVLVVVGVPTFVPEAVEQAARDVQEVVMVRVKEVVIIVPHKLHR